MAEDKIDAIIRDCAGIVSHAMKLARLDPRFVEALRGGSLSQPAADALSDAFFAAFEAATRLHNIMISDAVSRTQIYDFLHATAYAEAKAHEVRLKSFSMAAAAIAKPSAAE
jgi:hypothetical protein